jgi:hypothetical protein
MRGLSMLTSRFLSSALRRAAAAACVSHSCTTADGTTGAGLMLTFSMARVCMCVQGYVEI